MRALVDVIAHAPGLVVDMRYATADNFTGAPLPGYLPGRAWLLEPAARSLGSVQEELRSLGLGLVVYDAYRPRRATLAMVRWCEAHDRLDLLDGWVSATSRHNHGTAVDLGLVDGEGQPLDMGGDFDAFDHSSWTEHAEGEPLARRHLLRDLLVARGWRPYRREWWHFELPVEGSTPRDVPYR